MTNIELKNYNSIYNADLQQNMISINSDFKLLIKLPEILFITSYPPRECGIATYSQDLIKAIKNKYNGSFEIKVCAVENNMERYTYTNDIKYVLNTDVCSDFLLLAYKINIDEDIKLIVIQHEFGFFNNNEEDFIEFLQTLNKPIILVFHTVLPWPDAKFKEMVSLISNSVEKIIVMTHSSEAILLKEYAIDQKKIEVIPHGTHLVPHSDKKYLKNKYELNGRTVLSTFGLLGSGKSIETTLDALPAIIEKNGDILFLIIGKTHPGVVKQEGEQYRQMLKAKIASLKLEKHVQFINAFLPLPEILEYLQLTDIYLFTSKDPHQAVSGTFSYAISCGCPVISTPIPHAMEVLKNDAGIIIDFENSDQLSKAVNRILSDVQFGIHLSLNGLHKMAPTAWENIAISHANLFKATVPQEISFLYQLPPINLDHLKKMTTDIGIIQFAKINQPDINSGYTLDDNARALIAMCQHYELTNEEADLRYISLYLNFIAFCLQKDGSFLNYVDQYETFTEQNFITNLEDSNGRAIWSLGYLISLEALLPEELIYNAETILQKALVNVTKIHSTRAMAFVIKGLYYHGKNKINTIYRLLIDELADRLVQMYHHESEREWRWFESYLTYANSILPEAMLCAWLATGEIRHKVIAKSSFDFLINKIFKENQIRVISNLKWLHKGFENILVKNGGEQPIDVAYTIIMLDKFYEVYRDEEYHQKMNISVNWFLGANHLKQIIYNPCTGGCYDGLEENYVNLNQGAESTVSYLMARLVVERLKIKEEKMLGIEKKVLVMNELV